jgi:hypothetical protein
MQKEGYEAALRSSAIAKDDNLALTLAPRFAVLSVTTVPDGLTIRINEQSFDTPLVQHRFQPGDYTIVVDDLCYQPEGKRLTLKKGDQSREEIRPKQRLARVQAHARDAGGNECAHD